MRPLALNADNTIASLLALNTDNTLPLRLPLSCLIHLCLLLLSSPFPLFLSLHFPLLYSSPLLPLLTSNHSIQDLRSLSQTLTCGLCLFVCLCQSVSVCLCLSLSWSLCVCLFLSLRVGFSVSPLRARLFTCVLTLASSPVRSRSPHHPRDRARLVTCVLTLAFSSGRSRSPLHPHARARVQRGALPAIIKKIKKSWKP